jgi:hypothetical protein
VNPGMAAWPRASAAALRVIFLVWGGWPAAAGRWGVVTDVRGWSGRSGGWAAGGFEEVHPFLFAVPALGQVHGEVAAAMAGDAGGDVDEVTAQRGAPGFGASEAGQGSGGAQQVVADGGEGNPGRVGRERALDGRWARGPWVQSASTCSTMAWPRCWASAWMVSNGESVKMAWQRQAGGAPPVPCPLWRLRSLTRRTISRAVIARPFFEVNAV